jgi:hypothetical protein
VKLVDEQVRNSASDVRRDTVIALQELHGMKNEILKIERVCFSQKLAITLVYLDGELQVERVAGGGFDPIESKAFAVLDLVAELSENCTSVSVRGWHREPRVHHSAGEKLTPPRVVEDAEWGADADGRAVTLEDVGADGMEGSGADAAIREPIRQLLRRAARKGHRQNLLGIDALLQQASHTLSKSVRLAAARPGQDQEMPPAHVVFDDVPLFRGWV